MTWKAKVEDDVLLRGVLISMANFDGAGGGYALSFPDPTATRTEEGGGATVVTPLHLGDEAARALYEALADHFGHAGHDIRALRKDYDAERARVDKFINHLTGTR